MIHGRVWLSLTWAECLGQTNVSSPSVSMPGGLTSTLNHSHHLEYALHSTAYVSLVSAGSGSNFPGWRCREVGSALRQEHQRQSMMWKVAVAHVLPTFHQSLRWLAGVALRVPRQTNHAGEIKAFPECGPLPVFSLWLFTAVTNPPEHKLQSQVIFRSCLSHYVGSPATLNSAFDQSANVGTWSVKAFRNVWGVMFDSNLE